jgi:hypothetical protein
MPIFSRRVLQQLLDATDPLLSDEQSHRRLTILNSSSAQALDVEWETVFLYALGRLACVEHEASLSGRRPDLRVRFMEHQFVADVATVNDSGYERENPATRFQTEVWRRVTKAGVAANGIHIRIGAHGVNGKVRLLIPAQHQWKLFFDDRFGSFLTRVRERRNEPAAVHFRSTSVDVEITYTPGRPFAGGGFSFYKSAASLTQNPIYNALKRKREQLNECCYVGLLGIILCDGDCHDLKGCGAIVNRFLRGTSTISFVAVVTLNGSRFSRAQHPLRVVVRCYTNPRYKTDPRLGAVANLLEEQATRILPDAVDDPANARIRLETKQASHGLHRYGGWKCEDRGRNHGGSMRISSRALHGLLAGHVTGEQFRSDHGFTGGMNPFKQFFDDGCSIKAVRIEASTVDDDDWVVFEFAKDPAISPFDRPSQGQNSNSGFNRKRMDT